MREGNASPMLHALATLVVVGAIGAACGAAYTQVVASRALVGASVGACIGCLLGGFEALVVQRPLGAPLRRLPLPAFIAVSTVVWGIVIVAALDTVPPLVTGLERGARAAPDSRVQDVAFSFAVSFVVNFALRVRSLIGGRVLVNFLLGRYHRPLPEERAFMFLDLVGSTALAERLGDERVQALIGRFFFDIAAPIAAHGGETHRYVGDEVVVTWPLAAARADGRCLRCVLAIEATLAARAEAYRREFGVVPRYRAGLHGGRVVASEVGDAKREIVYFGDTVNTAARVAALCRALERDVLVSAPLLAGMPVPAGVTLEPMGEVALRGRATTLAVSALHAVGPDGAERAASRPG